MTQLTYAASIIHPFAPSHPNDCQTLYFIRNILFTPILRRMHQPEWRQALCWSPLRRGVCVCQCSVGPENGLFNLLCHKGMKSKRAFSETTCLATWNTDPGSKSTSDCLRWPWEHSLSFLVLLFASTKGGWGYYEEKILKVLVEKLQEV